MSGFNLIVMRAVAIRICKLTKTDAAAAKSDYDNHVRHLNIVERTLFDAVITDYMLDSPPSEWSEQRAYEQHPAADVDDEQAAMS